MARKVSRDLITPPPSPKYPGALHGPDLARPKAPNQHNPANTNNFQEFDLMIAGGKLAEILYRVMCWKNIAVLYP